MIKIIMIISNSYSQSCISFKNKQWIDKKKENYIEYSLSKKLLK